MLVIPLYSESLAHRLSLAAEFGLEMEEEDRPMYEFAQKLQVCTLLHMIHYWQREDAIMIY